MRTGYSLLVSILLLAAPGTANAKDCAGANGFGASRLIEVDTKGGPVFGALTKLKTAPNLLAPNEVVLTFDDGPMPWITKSILDTLDRHCAKATFFSVGKMAAAYPATVKGIVARGHTLGTHTWSHPLNLKQLKRDKAIDEIERGFTAVAAAAEQPIAPFFRFPGLSDSPELVAHLKERKIATFTVDIVSNDSFIASPERLTRETIAKVEASRGGIVLFHDIKASTAKALPQILTELNTRGYRIVHLIPKAPLQPSAPLVAEVKPAVTAAGQEPKRLLPFYGAAGLVAKTDQQNSETFAEAKTAAAADPNAGAAEEAAKPETKRPVKKVAKAPEPKRQISQRAYAERRTIAQAPRPTGYIGESWSTTIWTPSQRR